MNGRSKGYNRGQQAVQVLHLNRRGGAKKLVLFRKKKNPFEKSRCLICGKRRLVKGRQRPFSKPGGQAWN